MADLPPGFAWDDPTDWGHILRLNGQMVAYYMHRRNLHTLLYVRVGTHRHCGRTIPGDGHAYLTRWAIKHEAAIRELYR